MLTFIHKSTWLIMNPKLLWQESHFFNVDLAKILEQYKHQTFVGFRKRDARTVESAKWYVDRHLRSSGELETQDDTTAWDIYSNLLSSCSSLLYIRFCSWSTSQSSSCCPWIVTISWNLTGDLACELIEDKLKTNYSVIRMPNHFSLQITFFQSPNSLQHYPVEHLTCDTYVYIYIYIYYIFCVYQKIPCVLKRESSNFWAMLVNNTFNLFLHFLLKMHSCLWCQHFHLKMHSCLWCQHFQPPLHPGQTKVYVAKSPSSLTKWREPFRGIQESLQRKSDKEIDIQLNMLMLLLRTSVPIVGVFALHCSTSSHSTGVLSVQILQELCTHWTTYLICEQMATGAMDSDRIVLTI